MGSLKISRPLSQLLVQRGIRTYKEAESFFRPTLDELHDPFLMKNMDVAVDRIRAAIDGGEKVLIYGDYDVDGTTAVALVYSFFKDHFRAIDYYIPDRYGEGYGISLKGIDYAVREGFSLIIALDCGIKAIDKVAYAREKGVEFIICDHHNPGDEVPDAAAVLDAKQVGCNYPYKELSGCGVGLKLVQAFLMKNKLPKEQAFEYLDLVVVSIASDIVPITGENRILAHYGLKKLNKNPSTGLSAILDVANIRKKPLDIEDIVFKIGPRINAAGRMESGRKSVDLLVCREKDEACCHSKEIDRYNKKRRDIDFEITQEAIEMIRSNPALKAQQSTVLFNPKWNKGVIGIVASRLLDHFYKPTVILTQSNGLATGSARSVNGFDLYQAIESCADLLENFGGHKYAAGLTMKPQNVPLFKKRFEQFVKETIDPGQLIPVLEIDTLLKLQDIDDKFFRILKQFRPFGPENPNPVFLTENVVDNGDGRVVGNKGEHLRLNLIQEEHPFRVFPAIAFQRGRDYSRIRNGMPFDICYQLTENHYQGKVSLQIHILHLKFD
ncbi:MAG: single-stranded-DNA-specific exonuclease RecJ [Bacteroidetes bacterium]|nr:MAG: single-stranded-DNA-specific exonuclease RecJ [Bacteroidota bacterium]